MLPCPAPTKLRLSMIQRCRVFELTVGPPYVPFHFLPSPFHFQSFSSSSSLWCVSSVHVYLYSPKSSYGVRLRITVIHRRAPWCRFRGGKKSQTEARKQNGTKIGKKIKSEKAFLATEPSKTQPPNDFRYRLRLKLCTLTVHYTFLHFTVQLGRSKWLIKH